MTHVSPQRNHVLPTGIDCLLGILVTGLFLLLIIPAAAANPLPPPETMTTPDSPSVQVSAGLPLDWNRVTPDVAFSGRQGHSTVIFDGSVWVIGGMKPPDTYLPEVWRSDDGMSWTKVTGTPGFGKRAGHRSVVFNNKIWVIGGRDGNTLEPKNDVWYSSDGITWTRATASAPFAPRWDFGLTVFDGRMWVIGGSEDGPTHNDVWYSSDGFHWTEATPHAAFSPRMEPSAITYNGKIWVTGGFDWARVYNDVWTSENGRDWTLILAHAPFPARRYQNVETADGKLWVIGGSTLRKTINDIWYTTDGITWTQTASQKMFPPRYAFTTASFNNRLWVIGGTTGNDVWYADLRLSGEPATAPGAEGEKPAILRITKTVSPASIKTGTDSVVTITIANRGAQPVYDVEVLDPAHPDFPVMNGTAWASYPAIEANETKTLSYSIRASNAGTFQLNRTTVMYAEKDGNYRMAYSGYGTVRVLPSLLTPGTEETPDDLFGSLIAWINSLNPFE